MEHFQKETLRSKAVLCTLKYVLPTFFYQLEKKATHFFAAISYTYFKTQMIYFLSEHNINKIIYLSNDSDVL